VTRLGAGETTCDVAEPAAGAADDSGGVQRAENEKDLGTEEHTADGVEDMVVDEVQRAEAGLPAESAGEEDTVGGELGELQGVVTDGADTEDDTAATDDDGGGFEVTIEEPPKKKARSKVDYPGNSKTAFFKLLADRVQNAADRIDEEKVVEKEIYELGKDKQEINTILANIKEFRKVLKGRGLLPKVDDRPPAVSGRAAGPHERERREKCRGDAGAEREPDLRQG